MIATDTIKQAAELALALYDDPEAKPVEWYRRIDAPICWSIVQINDLWYIVFRGSKTRDDWLHDFEAVAVWNGDLNAHVHPGFTDGVKDILLAALAIIGDDNYVICGHSLGAARAAIAAAYAIYIAPKRPVARIVWGEPRPGFSDLAAILADIPNYNFENCGENGYDKVTDVPFTLPLEWYCAGSPHLFIHEPPISENPLMIFAWHNFKLYHAAMLKLPDGGM